MRPRQPLTAIYCISSTLRLTLGDTGDIELAYGARRSRGSSGYDVRSRLLRQCLLCRGHFRGDRVQHAEQRMPRHVSHRVIPNPAAIARRLMSFPRTAKPWGARPGPDASGWSLSTALGETRGRNRRVLTRCFSSLVCNPGRGILSVVCTLQKQVCDRLASLSLAGPRRKHEDLGRIERVCESDWRVIRGKRGRGLGSSRADNGIRTDINGL